MLTVNIGLKKVIYEITNTGVLLERGYAGVISVGGLLLARIPIETLEERSAYYQSRANDQLQAADNELMKSNAHHSMTIDRPSRRSRVSFGGLNKG